MEVAADISHLKAAAILRVLAQVKSRAVAILVTPVGMKVIITTVRQPMPALVRAVPSAAARRNLIVVLHLEITLRITAPADQVA